MDTSNKGIQVRACNAVGNMEVEAIFDRLDQRILESAPFHYEGVSALVRNFETVQDENGLVSKEAFTALFFAKTNLPPGLTEAAGILFGSLCYLSTAPLQPTSPPQESLSLKELKRALTWCFPDITRSIIMTTAGYRDRSPADYQRLIFQSLATSYTGSFPLPDSVSAMNLATKNARKFPLEYRGGPVDDKDINFDGDGDEMFHDVLDFLASTMPYVPPTYAELHRDSFRDLAKKFHADAPSLSDLAVPRHRLEVWLSLLLETKLRNRTQGCAVDAELELQGVSESIAACFLQSGPIDASTWPMFNFAMTKLLPLIFESFYDLLRMIFFDQPCRFDSNTGYAEPSPILTLTRMVQLESFLFNSIDTTNISRFECVTSAAGLIQAINKIPECALLVTCGHTADGEKYVFGAFIARPLEDGPCIQPCVHIENEWSFDERALLFQLSPTHDVFRGKAGVPAWSLSKDDVVFGDKIYGTALTLDNSLTKALFTHRLFDADAHAVYSPTVHRGDFEILLTIDGIEVWGEFI